MRFFIIPRMGCLTWLFVGWFLLAFYFAAYLALFALVLLLYLISATGLLVDLALVAAIPRYKRRRSEMPMSWHIALRTQARQLALSALGQKRRPARQLTPARVGTGPPAGWYLNPAGGALRWWDGTKWTEHVQPK